MKLVITKSKNYIIVDFLIAIKLLNNPNYCIAFFLILISVVFLHNLNRHSTAFSKQYLSEIKNMILVSLELISLFYEKPNLARLFKLEKTVFAESQFKQDRPRLYFLIFYDFLYTIIILETIY